MARKRIIRASLSKPLTVGQTGIKVKDLYVIIGLTFLTFLLLTMFGGSIRGVPLSVPAAFLVLVTGSFVSRHLSTKRRPLWLKYKTEELIREISGFGHNLLPHNGNRVEKIWLTDYAEKAVTEREFIRRPNL